jgi:hypothetical protein
VAAGFHEKNPKQPTDEQLRVVKNLIAARQLDAPHLRLVDFVELAERKEAETGEPYQGSTNLPW